METKFKVVNINLVNCWGYNLQFNTDCTICRCNLNATSLYNQDKGIDSQIADGICGHTFHYECIKPWIDKNKHCPICSSQWQYKNLPKISKNN